MSGNFLVFMIADLVGATTLWLLTRSGAGYAWVWSVGAWVAVAAIGLGLIPFETVMPIAAMTMVIGVGLIAPLVGVIAALVLLASPILAGQLLWVWWRRRRGVATRVSQAVGP